MPLIECPDCGKQVSDRASSCIGCGAPLNDNGETKSADLNEPVIVKFDIDSGLFYGTIPLIAKLAALSVQALKWKVDTINENVGLVTFQTGLTWGSWSGVIGSLTINAKGDNFFEVVGSGKQNLAGGQFIAVNFYNEAEKKHLKLLRR